MLSEHPELKVLSEHRYKLMSPIDINGINPVLHVLLEAVVEKQLQDKNPPETKETVERLVKEGFSGHAARAALASLLIPYIFKALKEKEPFNEESFVNRAGAYARKGGV
ncbi:DUF1841 family protein [Pelotomaculum sp. FP]|uniref:DUF1841 family protein n=1 Tax=Pelotomaculum sp. FP TaxID=261474 RepID=UPI00249E4D7E|nr:MULTISPECIES: DUF1841 family protein [Pelotomaculum]